LQSFYFLFSALCKLPSPPHGAANITWRPHRMACKPGHIYGEASGIGFHSFVYVGRSLSISWSPFHPLPRHSPSSGLRSSELFVRVRTGDMLVLASLGVFSMGETLSVCVLFRGENTPHFVIGLLDPPGRDGPSSVCVLLGCWSSFFLA